MPDYLFPDIPRPSESKTFRIKDFQNQRLSKLNNFRIKYLQNQRPSDTWYVTKFSRGTTIFWSLKKLGELVRWLKDLSKSPGTNNPASLLTNIWKEPFIDRLTAWGEKREKNWCHVGMMMLLCCYRTGRNTICPAAFFRPKKKKRKTSNKTGFWCSDHIQQ